MQHTESPSYSSEFAIILLGALANTLLFSFSFFSAQSNYAILLIASILLPLPFFVLSFSYGTRVSFSILLLTAIILLFFSTFAMALAAEIYIFFPAFLAAWLLGFKFEPLDNKAKSYWFPLSTCLIILLLYHSLITALGAYFFAPSKALQLFLSKMSSEILNSLKASDMPQYLRDIFSNKLEDSYDGQLPTIAELQQLLWIGLISFMSCVNFALSIFSLYLGLRFAQKQGRAARPFIPWPQSFYVPPSGLIISALLCLISLFGPQMLHGSAFSLFYVPLYISLVLFFLLSGFFAIHAFAAQFAFRKALLLIFYLLLIFVPWFLALMLIALSIIGGVVSIYRINRHPLAL